MDPEKKKEDRPREKEEDRPREEDAQQWSMQSEIQKEKQMVQHLEWMNCTPKLGVNKRTPKPQTPSN
jgi:hypothetical protein